MKAAFQVYSASAGSGKTFLLAVSYLTAALKDPNRPGAFRHIMALTFMNKAAKEMRERILKTLVAASEATMRDGQFQWGEAEDLANAVQKKLGINQEEMHHRAKKVLHAMLHDYGSIAIGTLDQFTHRLVRTFAIELGLPGQFDVEIEQDTLLEMSLAALYQDLGEDATLTTMLSQFVAQNIEDEKAPDIHDALMNMAKELPKEAAGKAIEAMQAFSSKDHLASQQAMRQLEKSLQKEALQLVDRYQALLESLPEEGVSRISTWHSNQDKLRSRDYAKWRPTPTIDGFIESPEKALKKAFQGSHAASIEAIAEPLALCVKDQWALAGRADVMRSIRRHDRSAAVLMAMAERLELVMDRLGVQPLWKFNRLIQDELSQQPASYLYERLGERYSDFFIDEAQDTSALQWKNLWPLLAHGLSSLNAAGESGTALIVGDGKQSIYRWRGSEAEAFLAMNQRARDGKSPDESMPSLTGRTAFETLPNNYRSRHNIVAFNNDFFTEMADESRMPSSIHREAYADISQSPKGKEGGLVQVQFMDGDHSEERQESTLDALVADIREALGAGWSLSDMAILTRSKRDGHAIAERLAFESLPVLSSDLLTLDASPHVQAIVAVMHWMLAPAIEDRQLQVMLRCHDAGIGWVEQDELVEACMALPGKTSRQPFNRLFKAAFPEFDEHIAWKLGLYELGEYLARCLNLAHESNPFILRLLDTLQSYAANKLNRLEAFVNQWDIDKTRWCISAPEGQEAVQLLTIHKAKGLEFPMVFFPFATWENKRPNLSWMDDSWAEQMGMSQPPPATLVNLSSGNSKEAEQRHKALEFAWPALSEAIKKDQAERAFDDCNLLYVAMTRAVDVLMIYTSDASRTGSFGLWMKAFMEGQHALQGSVGTIGERPSPPMRPLLTAKRLPFMHSSDWTNRVRLASHKSLTEEQAIGDAVHVAMEGIRTAADMQLAVDAAIHQFKLQGEAATKVKALVNQAVTHPSMQSFMAATEVYCERPVMVGKQVFRPDRLMKLQDGKWAIIDYKTGQPDSKHGKQIAIYADALEGLLGNRPSTHLVYLRSQHIDIISHGN